MSDNAHNEIMRAIGNLEGKIDGINFRLDTLNGRVGKHDDKINIIESNQQYRRGQIVIIGAIVGGVISFVWNFISNRIN